METITIKSYDELEKLAVDFSDDGFELPDGSFFNTAMSRHCGKTITITEELWPRSEPCYKWRYGGYQWSELMVETKSDNFKLIYDILNS